MNYYVLTLFPEIIYSSLNHSIMKRAMENKIIELNLVNIRDFSNSKNKQVDDYPYGGGAGMVLKPEPIYNAYLSIKKILNKDTRVIYMTPKGKVFNQEIAREFSKEENLIILCGHYEGIDERVVREIVTDEISVGDYILTGGEVAAIVFIDAVSRLKEGVLNNKESCSKESFENNLLEYPQYTRPFKFMDKEVPKVLLSGNHKEIDKWRKEQSLIETFLKRPDLLNQSDLNKKYKDILDKLSYNSKNNLNSIDKKYFNIYNN